MSRWRNSAAVVLLALVSLAPAGAADPSAVRPMPGATGATDALSAAIVARLHAGAFEAPASRAEQQELQRLYPPGRNAARWLDAGGRPGPQAQAALALLTTADREGLVPADYHAEALAQSAARLAGAGGPAPDEAAAWELGLSLGVLRYLRHLHVGRVDPSAVRFRLPVRDHHHDFAALLDEALQGHRLTALVTGLTPPFGQYRALREELARYRGLAASPPPAALQTVPALAAGQRHAVVPALRERLRMLGDLPAHEAVDPQSDHYDAPLAEAVRRFQLRHGLGVDGVLGRSTQETLNVPLARRVRQIELAMERLRWLPHPDGRPFIAINIPMFRLWAWSAGGPDAEPALNMRVVVGRALDTQTPVFTEEMRYLVFRPYWNVPSSIVRQEILPALERDPGYLDRHEMELVAGASDDAPAVAATPAHLALLRQGGLRLRQRPGPRNALGAVKFIFPNAHNVYLHGTPALSWFERSRRDASHGCVRLEDPLALAQWVLRDQPQWTRERIEAAAAGKASLRVDLPQPLRVMLFYVTAAVVPGEGVVHFVADVYGHDRRLEALLARPPAR
ncbi:L,D-transpeptidase family protein [Caldimonas brevitalea]|uniref:L,D-transpeptidase family protein n=1 Tax=Caldimonas brevitalea TaxID=413882 RepID=UPI000AF94969|nr:L,D-transpeptidase family protein [Caldimonas brevitalea]